MIPALQQVEVDVASVDGIDETVLLRDPVRPRVDGSQPLCAFCIAVTVGRSEKSLIDSCSMPQGRVRRA